MTKEALQARVRDLATKALAITQKAESEGRGLTEAERSAINGYLADVASTKAEIQVYDLTRVGNGADLLAQFRAAGFVPNVSKGSIPFWGKTAVFDGGAPDRIDPIRRDGVPLGFDSRFIFELFPRVPVDSTTTSVEVLRQSSRTLATSDSMIRRIDSDSTKPETATNAALITLALNQVATVETSVPNVLAFNPAFASFIQNDLRLAYERALDWMVVDAINDANPALSSASTLPVAVLTAAETILADGYNPSVVVLNPATWRDYVTLRATDPYINNNDPLRGFRFVVSNSYFPADGLVLDPAAVGKLYQSPVSLQSFEENAGASNSQTVRIESHAAFNVERLDAIAEIDVT